MQLSADEATLCAVNYELNVSHGSNRSMGALLRHLTPGLGPHMVAMTTFINILVNKTSKPPSYELHFKIDNKREGVSSFHPVMCVSGSEWIVS